MARQQHSPAFEKDGPVPRSWNLINAAANKPATWWFFFMLILLIGTLAFFIWDTRNDNKQIRADNKQIRDAQILYMATDSRAILQALQNNTAALEQSTRMIDRLSNRQNQ